MAADRRKAGREAVVLAGLKLLDEQGLERLTLGAIAQSLNVRAPSLYWRFSSKQDLVDEMATQVVADWLEYLSFREHGHDWRGWAVAFATSFRAALIARRDGARLVAGTHLKDNVLLRPMEEALRLFASAGIGVPDAVLCIKTLYDFVIGFTLEEQAVTILGKRDPRYSLEDRPARVGDDGDFSLSIEAGPYLLDNYDARFAAGVRLILDGFAGHLSAVVCGQNEQALATRAEARA